MIADAGYGFTTVICVGGDPVLGTTMQDVVRLFEKDPETKAIVMVGEVGGSDEVDSIEEIKGSTKPVFAYIAGHCAPAKKKMGHAGAIKIDPKTGVMQGGTDPRGDGLAAGY